MTTAAEHDDQPTISIAAYTEPVSEQEMKNVREARVSPLEALAAELERPAERKENLRLVPPQRPNITMIFDPNITSDERKAWLKRAEERPTGNRARRRSRAITGEPVETDAFVFACLVLAHTNRGIEIGGDLATKDGQPLTLRDETLWAMMKQIDPQAAIRWLYGNDQHVEGTAGEIVGASGIDDDLEEVDPTEGAS